MIIAGFVLCELARTWGAPAVLTVLTDKRITESSGIAASPTKANTYYTHNDSGDTARFFQFSKSGVIAEYSLDATKAIDWEEMSSARLRGKNWLFIGDIGDNKSSRKSIKIYKLEEPSGKSTTIKNFETYEITYPEGPQNCEAMFVAPGTGHIYLVTKDEKVARIYILRNPRTFEINKLEKLGEIKVDTGLGKYGRLITGAACDPSGKHVIIRTYSGALEYDVTGKFQDWWKAKPRTVNVGVGVQSEAICYTNTGKGVLTTSEGNPCPVLQVLLAK